MPWGQYKSKSWMVVKFWFISWTRSSKGRKWDTKRLALIVVITARKFRPYFQDHRIVIKPTTIFANYQQILTWHKQWSHIYRVITIWHTFLSHRQYKISSPNLLFGWIPTWKNTSYMWIILVDGASSLKGSGSEL